MLCLPWLAASQQLDLLTRSIVLGIVDVAGMELIRQIQESHTTRFNDRGKHIVISLKPPTAFKARDPICFSNIEHLIRGQVAF